MGKTDLGKWMITNGGEYSADATYEQLTMVKYGNSTYITLKTVTGITPTDDKINYQLMAQGFDATALSAVQAEDTQGLCGEKGEIVTAQSLVDALADKVMNTVMAKIGTAALTGGMTDLSSGINALYSDLNGLHVYTKISDLGLSNDITVNDILPKMHEPSIGFFYIFDDNIKKLPITTQANLIIFKNGSASDIVERSIWTGETYFGKYAGANKVESWIQI
nr:MAG TPA: hypothetical protein [Bacteriophage sp.]